MNGSTWRPERVMLGGLLAIYLLLAALYSWRVPPLEGFDALAHYRGALYLRTTGTLPLLDRTTLAASYELIAQPLLYHGLTAFLLTPLPVQDAWTLSSQLANPYFEKGLSVRQSLTLPDAGWRAVLPMYVAVCVSIAGGALALLGTWRLSRALVAARPTFALAATSLVVFNPLFLFLTVSVMNHAWATATVALCAAFAAEATFAPALDPSTRRRRWFWAGVWGGLALLTKYSGFLVGPPVAVLWLLMWQRHGAKAAWRGLGLALAGFLLVAGWWFMRMIWLYGEPIPLAQMDSITTLNRAEPLSWSELWEHVPWLIWSYWGIFVAVFAPAAFFATVRVLMLVGVIGLLLALLRRDDQRFVRQGWTLIMALLWAAVTAAAVLYWTRTISYGEQGRLAHIGAPAFALLMVVGWQSFLPDKRQPWLHGALAALMVGLALWQSQTVADAYRIPPPVASLQPDRPLDVRFGDKMRLVGADFPNGAAIAPGMPLPLTLYWTTPATIPEQYTLFVHLAGSDNQLLVQFDGVPAEGRHPTRQWQPGDIFADEHLLHLPDDVRVTPGLATLSLGFYPIRDSGERLPVTDATGANLGDRLVLAPVEVRAAPATPQPAPAAPIATWQTGLVLADAVVQQGEDGPASASFTWWAQRTQQVNYTLFVQVLDAENNLLAQADVRGDRPTSVWREGDLREMAVALTLVPGADLRRWQRVIVGWYDATGTRLLLADGADFHTIATRERP